MDSNERVAFPEPGDVVVEECPVPTPNADEVLIETERSLISTGTETTVMTGVYPKGSVWDEMVEHPVTETGYSNVGTIVEIGADVDEELVGRQVATRAPHAKYATESAEDCLFVPADVSAEEATFFALARTSMNGVRRGDISWGEAIGVFGLGLLGQLTVQFCRVGGTRPLIAFDIAEERYEYLPDSPEIVPVNPTDDDWLDQVEEQTNGRMVETVFEVTGNANALTDELESLMEQGRLVLLSSPKTPVEFDFHTINRFSYEVMGAHIFHQPSSPTPENPWTGERHGELFFDLLSDGEIDIERLISHRASYRDAPDMYEMLLKDRTSAMGVVLEW